MKLSEFDFNLPTELIAQYPADRRETAKLLVVDRKTGRFHDKHISDLPDYFKADDCLVLNETKVFPARLWGVKEPSGGRVEVLLIREHTPRLWSVLASARGPLRDGQVVTFGEGQFSGTIRRDSLPDSLAIEFDMDQAEVWECIYKFGQMPTPPYIKRGPDTSEETEALDRERYQTVFARELGSIAAPTAGLHFTPEILEGLKAKGVDIARVILHVGPGTFQPVRTEVVEEHKMGSEYYEITKDAAEVINKRTLADDSESSLTIVGTTSTRALESSSEDHGRVITGQGWTEIFIYPGYRFKVVDRLMTNFHLPKSTLFMLVCALAGNDLMKAAYEHAIKERYRFFSYGDAMLIL